MALMRLQAIHKSRSGLAEDDMVNTFYFLSTIGGIPSSGSVNEAAVTNIAFMVGEFFTQVVPSNTFNVNYFRGMDLLDIAVPTTIKGYDMSQPTPREPIAQVDPPTGGGGTGVTALPAEVACCLSYRGPNAALVPARRRGRLFIGPLNFNTLPAGGSAASGRPLAIFTETLRLSGVRLANATEDAGWSWVIMSPTASVFPNYTTTLVRELITDDAFDTQRRRGPDPTRRDIAAV